MEDKSEISLPAFKLLFSPFLLLLQNTSNLNIVSHILEDILDIYTKPDSELYEWMSTNLPAKEISEMIVDSLSKMPSKNNKMVQEYLKKWGSVVGIPFVDQIVITGMDVKKVYNGLEGGAKRDPPSVTNSLSKKPKLDIEKDQSQPIPNPKKKKDVVPKKVKNVGSEDVSGAHSKIPVPVVPVQAVSSNITTNGKKSPKRVSKKNELVEGVVKEGGGNQVVTPKTGKKGTLAAPLEPVVVAKLEEKIQQKKSPKTSKKPKVSAEIELSSSVQTTNGEAAHLIEAQKSPKKANEAKPVKSPKKPELEGQDSVESFESFDNLAEPSIEGSESSHSARSRNLARTIPADTIALLHKTLKSKKPKKKTVKKSKVLSL